LAKRLNSQRFVVHNVKEEDQLRNAHQVVELMSRVEQFQLSPLLPHGRKGTHQVTQACAVDVIDLAKIQKKLFIALERKLANLLTHCSALFTNNKASLRIHDGDIA